VPTRQLAKPQVHDGEQAARDEQFKVDGQPEEDASLNEHTRHEPSEQDGAVAPQWKPRDRRGPSTATTVNGNVSWPWAFGSMT
jgi:hypothetical protein